MKTKDYLVIPVAVSNSELIGRRVERQGSSKDYTTGRTGEIVEIDGDRFRVRWTHESGGEPISKGRIGVMPNGVRTWVNKKFLLLID